jgi:predicted NAD/FAD-dependent oxidoreductase
MTKTTVAIIGAGLAGLSAATRLQALGYDVRLFEKSRGPSGRMSTRVTEIGAADHGAQYFTARDPAFVAELGRWIAEGLAAEWTPRLKVFEGGEWRLSHSRECRFVGTPAMNSPGKALARHLHVDYGLTIEAVRRVKDQWRLSSREAGDIAESFDDLVVAVPAPQAFMLMRPIDPSIADRHSVEMLGCWTLMAFCSESVPVALDAAFVNGEIISWIARNSSKPGRDPFETWTIHGNPQWSQEWIDLDPEEAGRRLLTAVATLGIDVRGAQISVHRWRYASGSTPAAPGFYFDSDLRWGLCGDWLNGGRVEGAWLSGYRLAEMMHSLRPSSKTKKFNHLAC